MTISLDKMYEFEDTLKNTSYDKSHNEYLSDSGVKAISFDEFKEFYCKSFNKRTILLNSVDAVFIEGNRIIFIEFKNGNIENKNIKYKIKDSILMCSDILDVSIRYFRKHASAIVVYNQDKYPVKNKGLEVIKSAVLNKANNKEVVKFGLEMYKGMFLKEVHTYTQKEFDEYVKANLMQDYSGGKYGELHRFR